MRRWFRDRSGWGLGALVSAFAFVLCVSVGWMRNEGEWEHALRSSNDANGYFEFLPALFVRHDLDSMSYAIPAANGRTLNVQHMGVAWMEAPFFLATRSYHQLRREVTTGWEPSYAKARVIASALYCALGLLFLFLHLRSRATAPVAAVTALSLLATTSLLYYASVEPGYSHVHSFFLFAWLVHLTPRLNECATNGRMIALGVCSTLILLVRPMNAPVLLYPLLAGACTWSGVRTRVRDWSRARAGAAIGAAIALLLASPQLWYWHRATGSWITFTYGQKNEHFDLTAFHGIDVLFSHQNGWFIYSPLMLPVMVALGTMAWRSIATARTVLAIWAIAWLTYAFWWCWWLGGSFGFRGFIEHGALLAVPLAWLVQQALRRTGSSIAWAVFLVACVHANLVFTEIYEWPWEGDGWTWERVRHIYAVAFLE